MLCAVRKPRFSYELSFYLGPSVPIFVGLDAARKVFKVRLIVFYYEEKSWDIFVYVL